MCIRTSILLQDYGVDHVVDVDEANDSQKPREHIRYPMPGMKTHTYHSKFFLAGEILA